MEQGRSPRKWNTAHVKYWQLFVNGFRKSIILFQWMWLQVLALNLNVHKEICEQEETKKGKCRLSKLFVHKVCSWYFGGLSSAWSAVLLNSVLSLQTCRKTFINSEVDFFLFFPFSFFFFKPSPLYNILYLNGQQLWSLQKHFASPEKRRDFSLLAIKALKSSKLSPKLQNKSLRVLQVALKKAPSLKLCLVQTKVPSEPTAAFPDKRYFRQVMKMYVRAMYSHPCCLSRSQWPSVGSKHSRERDWGNENSFRNGRKVTDEHFGLAGEKRFPFQGISLHHSSFWRVIRIQRKSDPAEIKALHVPLHVFGLLKVSY